MLLGFNDCKKVHCLDSGQCPKWLRSHFLLSLKLGRVEHFLSVNIHSAIFSHQYQVPILVKTCSDSLHIHAHSVSLTLSIYLSLSLSHTLTYSVSLTHTLSHTLSLSLCLSLSLFLSLTH